MANTGWDLIKLPWLRKLAAAADEINNHASEVVEALSEYEGASDDEDPTQARADAREAFASAVGDLRHEMRHFENLAARFDAEADDPKGPAKEPKETKGRKATAEPLRDAYTAADGTRFDVGSEHTRGEGRWYYIIRWPPGAPAGYRDTTIGGSTDRRVVQRRARTAAERGTD